jgi:REP element-mobilizing transposase RayT
MPNHIHGIIALNEPVGTRHAVFLPERFGEPVIGSISTIVRSFKSAVTDLCRRNGCLEFKWQARYYEHIIRSEKDLSNIRDYIINNPVKWFYDEENPDTVNMTQ